MAPLSFKTRGPLGARASLGLIALSTDETVEHELRAMLGEPGVELYTSRIASDPDITPETLARMAETLSGAAALLPKTLDYAAIAYACTSASSVIGSARVAELVRAGATTTVATNPLDAVIDACRALAVKRLAFVTPYSPAVSATLRARLEEAGLEIAGFGSFEQIEERVIARIDGASLRAAARSVAAQAPADAVFLSCTNLRCLNVIPAIEAETGLAAISSNQALGWRLARAADLRLDPLRFGSLMASDPPAEA